MNLKGAAPEKFGAIKSFFYRLWAEPSIEPMHRRIASEVPIETGRLLDIGCGGGKVDRLIAAARPNVRVVGLDSSEAMLRSARKRSSAPNLEFRLGTIESSLFSGEFDFALSVLSFHHWEEPVEGLTAVCRALASTVATRGLPERGVRSSLPASENPHRNRHDWSHRSAPQSAKRQTSLGRLFTVSDQAP